MLPSWWHIPGPSRYVAGVCSTLQDGKNVVLCLPEHVPDGLSRAIVQAHPLPGVQQWEALRIPPDSQHTPVELLFSYFAPNALASTLRNAAALVREQGFEKKRIWLEGFTANTWSVWKTFFEEYEHVCRSILETHRTLFCVSLSGTLADTPPQAGISLTHARWYGVVSDLDMLLYINQIMPKHPLVGIKRKIAIAVAASLSLWDPLLADQLVRQPLRVLLEPEKFLCDFGRARGWHEESHALGWPCGARDLFNEREQLHSAAAACRHQCEEIKQRIWRAQLGLLFPIIEERRHRLLRELQGLLNVPFTTRERVLLNELHDLEIGHIEWQLLEHKRNGVQDIRLGVVLPQVSALKQMRNHLAHFEVLGEELLDRL